MKSFITSSIMILAIILVSCGSADKKTDKGEKIIEPTTDSTGLVPVLPVPGKDSMEVADTASSTTPKKTVKKTNTGGRSGQTRGTTRGMSASPAEILAGIDEYLISKAEFKPLATGGFTDCIITVTNTLPDITFQKAIVEVIIRKEDGTEVKRSYYTVITVEPGLSKLIRIPNSNQGSRVVTQVVKVKSNELTNGEWALAGNH